MLDACSKYSTFSPYATHRFILLTTVSTAITFLSFNFLLQGSKEKIKEHEQSALVLHMGLLLQVFDNIKTSLLSDLGSEDVNEAQVSGMQVKMKRLEDTLHSLRIQGAVEMNGEDLEVDSYTEPSVFHGDQKQGQELEECRKKLAELEQKIQVYENIVTVLNREVEKTQLTLAAFECQNRNDQESIKDLELKVTNPGNCDSLVYIKTSTMQFSKYCVLSNQSPGGPKLVIINR